ncbi:MAG TPA: hypothetical protein VD840_01255 [Sinorhizobium sp.]|nr:hypothetical protein [Sinorhizobium sp.]
MDVLGRVGAALRKRAHLGCDDGDPPARFARARRLDAGIERQQIGLEGDLVDDVVTTSPLCSAFARSAITVEFAWLAGSNSAGTRRKFNHA